MSPHDIEVKQSKIAKLERENANYLEAFKITGNPSLVRKMIINNREIVALRFGRK